MATSTLDARSDVINGLTRRRFLGGVSLAALLAACGSESGPGPSTTDDAIEGAGFPVTVDHKYGSTTIPAEPQRVVTVGFTASPRRPPPGCSPPADRTPPQTRRYHQRDRGRSPTIGASR